MTPQEHMDKIVKATVTQEYPHFHTATVSEAVVHAAIGIATEGAGELLDAVKKAMIYGKVFDVTNGDEEVGDVLWYVNLYCMARDITIEDLLEMNAAKLMLRYPNQFTEEAALNRDLTAERAVLEEHTILEKRDLAVPSEKVDRFDQTSITRLFIQLNEAPPEAGQEYIDSPSQRRFKYNGLQWDEVNDAG